MKSFFCALVLGIGALSTNPSLLASGVVSPCTETALRTAVAGGGPVTFGCDGTILVTSPLVITNDTSIDSFGRQITLSGGNSTRLFEVQGPAVLHLSGLTLAHGRVIGTTGGTNAPGLPGEGAAVLVGTNAVLRAWSCRFLEHQVTGGTGGPPPTFPPAAGAGGIGRGGAISSHGRVLELHDCEFANNRADGGTGGYVSGGSSSGGPAFGGAVYTQGGEFFANNVSWSNNVARGGRGYRLGSLHASEPARGGAIYSSSQARLSLSRFITNTALAEFIGPGSGGAFHQATGSLAVAECLFDRNLARGGDARLVGSPLGTPGAPGTGGAITIAAGPSTITASTFSGNVAAGGRTAPSGGGTGQGGALHLGATSQTSLTNVTFHANTAVGGPGSGAPSGAGEGGGIYNTSGSQVSLTHTTFARNAARSGAGGGTANGPGRGGAIASAGGSVLLRNSLLADSLSGSNWFGTGLAEAGRNLSSDASAPLTAPGSLINADPFLGPIASYSGPVPTVPLRLGSPAIDAADPAFCTGTDARGRSRPFGAQCDLGAFESSAPYFVTGLVTGHQPPAALGISLTTPAAPNAPSEASGFYTLGPLPPGTHTITPRSPDAVFVQSNQVVQVLADTIGINFHAYRTNALTFERLPNNSIRGVYAGEPGATYQILSTSSLAPANWTASPSIVMPNSGILEFLSPSTPPGDARFFQVIRP